jgi:hypothetical protein
MNTGKEKRKKENVMSKLFWVMIFTWVISLASQATCFATNASLQWNASTDTSVTGYKVYYQADSSTQPFNGTGATNGSSPVNVSNVTSATISGLDPSHSYSFAVTAYNASGVESSYSNVVSIAETQPPTVSITSPTNSSSVSGTVSVSASATDNVGVTKVEFYVNGALKATDTATPYLYSWNTSGLAAGTYTLMAKAYDAAGNVGQSSNVSVTLVNDTTAPTVSLTAPASGATVSGTVTLTANASDNVGVSKVEFYENGVLLNATNVAPYNCSWNTTTVANGSYTLTAKAYDAAGNVGQSSNVSVTVNNTVADTTAPTVSISAPVNGATVSGTTSVTASASDNVGVTKVEFYVNGALQITDTSSPYTFSWNTTAVTNGTYTLTAKAYDAAGNVGTSASTSVSVNNGTTAPPPGSYTAVFGNASGSNYPNTVQDTFLNINTDVNAASTSLNTYTWPANTPANTILMQWDLSALPAGAQIQSATLSLYLTASGGDASYLIPVSEVINKTPVIAKSNGATYDGVNAWTASSIPYGGIPLAESDIAAAVDSPQIDTAVGYKNWNVTNIVKDWLTTPANNKGLLLNSSNVATSDSYRTFASSEATDTTQRPKLVVTYTLPSDTTAPTVAISAPSNSATVSGTASVSVTASDNIGVTKVEFYVNGALQATDTASPYTFSWNTTTVANGSYTLTAKAYDAAGNVGQSANVSVTVSNTVADTTVPTVSISAPTSGATVNGTASVSVTASDNVGVIKVEFYVNGALQATDTASPYTFGWNTTTVANGTYTLTAKAYDAAGNVGQSANVSVTVNNAVADTAPPAVSAFSVPATSTTLAVPITTFTATDNVGVTGCLVNESATAPSATASGWSATPPTSYTFATAGSKTLYAWAKDAAGNVSASKSAAVTVTLAADTTPPTVAISSPSAGTRVRGSVTINASASDNVGVTSMQLYIDNVLKTTVSASTLAWTWNTNSYARGSHVIMVKAYDAANNVGTTSITVNR